MSSCHTTYTLLPSDEICGLSEDPVVSLIFSGSLNVSPPLVLLAKKISLLSGVSSNHTTYTLLPSDEICGANESSAFSLIFSGSLNVSPPSVLLAKKMSLLPGAGVSSSHTTYTLSPSDEISGKRESPAFSLMFSGVLNVRPPSVLLAKKISSFF